AEMERRTPLGRIGVPDDVARVVLFCASDLSMLMTGSTLLVDAGEGVL
ncbi:SDR family oxidoreductase, partial [Myxococcota bacterium]|nr:SDR family oxidoreductase [Myxococcota bacterium]